MQKSLLSSLCSEVLVLPINKEVVERKLCILRAESVVMFHNFVRLSLHRAIFSAPKKIKNQFF